MARIAPITRTITPSVQRMGTWATSPMISSTTPSASMGSPSVGSVATDGGLDVRVLRDDDVPPAGAEVDQLGEQSHAADDHQDDADGVDVEPVAVVDGDRERQNRADRDQEQAGSEPHG